MSTLDRTLRKKLADTIVAARSVAEEAAADAVRRLGVIEDEAPGYLSPDQKGLRVRLRAHARALGDGWNGEKKKLLSTRQLETEAAYEIWHRMLFGRFLVERELLIHPDFGVPIAASQLADLAREAGLVDPWALVERFAAPALPAVFKPDDPVLAMTLDPALSNRLRSLVAGLSADVFTADDSLGWTYQFWRTAEKDAVNKAGGKVGAAELPAVTQLFTEAYMVKFLLHNTLGAWWAGKILAANPDLALSLTNEQSLRDACSLPDIAWEFLRFVRDDEATGPWRPAAGVFPGWPNSAAEITFLDPCCGSGHFLVEAFNLLAGLRMAEENLSAEEATCAVLRDNLHGLEIDGRCVQIAAFNVALTAWRLAGGPITLPQPHIAWVGAQPPSRAEMAALANGDATLGRALEALHDQFAQAPLLGSLLEVGASDLLDSDLREGVEAALMRLHKAGPDRAEGAVTARGLLDAAGLLARRYVLQATNVPFLGRRKHNLTLAKFIDRHMPEAKADLATAMIQRMRRLASQNGVVASVTPQNWLFLGSYRTLREQLLMSASLSAVIVLGEHGFESNAAAGAFTALVVVQNTSPDAKTTFMGIDASSAVTPHLKMKAIRDRSLQTLSQAEQSKNPDTRVAVRASAAPSLLADFANSYVGLQNGDSPRWIQKFWEQGEFADRWSLFQMPTQETAAFGGRDGAILWEGGHGALTEKEGARVQGREAWGQDGVIVRHMRQLPCSLYIGDLYDQSSAVIVPHDRNHLAAIWAYCSSEEFNAAVREVDRTIKVTNATLVKVPFDVLHWQGVAASRYPDGLPDPYSDDVTQWLFHGHPAHAVPGTELHAALARLAGYQWPAETDSLMRLAPLARKHISATSTLPGIGGDGLLPLHATAQGKALADRLRDLLAAAYGEGWSNTKEKVLVRAADALLDKKEAKDASLDAWLRDRAFRQHCTLFHQRPFLWQVWDGGKDGFSAFVHYHRLDRATLEKLTYTMLGDWTARMKAEGRTAEEGWALQLRQRLAAIIEGEDPYDIFVRWKSLECQPMGWDPDLDDGVRVNIRPFMRAGVLRDQPRINWNKDRGTDVASAPWHYLGPDYGGKEGDRINDHHLTLAEKRAVHPKANVS